MEPTTQKINTTCTKHNNKTIIPIESVTTRNKSFDHLDGNDQKRMRQRCHYDRMRSFLSHPEELITYFKKYKQNKNTARMLAIDQGFCFCVEVNDGRRLRALPSPDDFKADGGGLLEAVIISFSLVFDFGGFGIFDNKAKTNLRVESTIDE